MTLCFTEWENKHLWDFSAKKFSYCTALRWIDDLYLVLSLFCLPEAFN